MTKSDLTSRSRTLLRGSIGVALGIGLGACQSDAPLDPTAADDPSVPIVATPQQLSAARMGLDDATGRLVPALERFAADGELRDALLSIADGVERRDRGAVERGLARARRTLALIEAASDGSLGADIDALRHSIADAATLLEPPSSSNVDPSSSQP